MLRAYLDQLTKAANFQAVETTSFANVKWEVSSSIQASIQDALNALPLVAGRDEYELLLDAGEEQLSITRASPPDQEALTRLHSAAIAIDSMAVSLMIRKRVVDHRASVYFADRFADYLTQAPLLDAVRSIAGQFRDRLEFEVFEPISAFFTSSIGFTSAGTSLSLSPDSAREDKLEAFRNNSNATGLPSGALPSDFYLLRRSDRTAFNRFFDEAAAVLSLAFLANTSELRGPNLLSYKLYGYKAVVSVDVPASGLVPVLKVLHEIYAWSYEGGSAADKLGLVRNVVSLHLDSSGQPQFDDFVRDAIHSNYQIYLKGNIQTYLEVKNKLADLLLDSVERTSKLADDVLESFKNNVFVVATFLLTVVVINGLKDTSFASIFSGAYVFLVAFLAVCSAFWMWLVRGDAFSRYRTSTDAMEGVLRTNYEKFLLKAEIDASLQPTLTRTSEVLTARIRKYCRWWTVLLILFVGFFATGYVTFRSETSTTSKTVPEEKSAKEAKSPDAEKRATEPAARETSPPASSTDKGKQGVREEATPEHAAKKKPVKKASSRPSTSGHSE